MNRTSPSGAARTPVARPRFDWAAASWAGIAAGIVSTLLQVLLWTSVIGDFPGALFRDARLAAAMLMGPEVLPPPASFDARVMVVATLVHFALSLAYGLLLGFAIRRFAWWTSLLAGSGFGLLLYVVNLYGFTALFPWMAQVRTWDTLLAHLVFGLVAAAVYWRLRRTAPARARAGYSS